MNEEIFGSPESGEEGDIETDADEDLDIIPDTYKENINLDSKEEPRKTDHHLKHIQKEIERRCEENSKKEEEGDNIEELVEFKDPKRNPLRHLHELLEQRRQEKSKRKATTDHPSEDSDSYHETSNSDPDWKRDSADLRERGISKTFSLMQKQRKRRKQYKHRKEISRRKKRKSKYK